MNKTSVSIRGEFGGAPAERILEELNESEIEDVLNGDPGPGPGAYVFDQGFKTVSVPADHQFFGSTQHRLV
jgi:hypothetical protein